MLVYLWSTASLQLAPAFLKPVLVAVSPQLAPVFVLMLTPALVLVQAPALVLVLAPVFRVLVLLCFLEPGLVSLELEPVFLEPELELRLVSLGLTLKLGLVSRGQTAVSQGQVLLVFLELEPGLELLVFPGLELGPVSLAMIVVSLERVFASLEQALASLGLEVGLVFLGL
jgi:hypothetical protein